MFPKPNTTPRGRELRSKFESEENLQDWPQPTIQDHALIGYVVVQFGYVDFNLRRLAELFDSANLLESNWSGKSARLTMAHAAAAVQSSSVWTGPLADMVPLLKEIEEHRAIRNLLAHCAIRRFPEDDALLFIFKSRRDYIEMYGEEPPVFTALGTAMDCDEIKKSIERVDDLQGRLAEITAELENKIDQVPLGQGRQ
jgi:hypothetical protein